QQPIDPIDDEDGVARIPAPGQRREDGDGVGRQPVEERMREDREQRDDEQRAWPQGDASFGRREEPVEQPQDTDNGGRQKGPGDDPMKRAPVELDPVDRKGERYEYVDVGRVGAEQASRKSKARAA